MSDYTMVLVYRHYDHLHNLLYVGITGEIVTRTKQHLRSSSWKGRIASVEVEEFMCPAEAAEREREVILAELPEFNKVQRSQRNSGAADRRMVPILKRSETVQDETEGAE